MWISGIYPHKFTKLLTTIKEVSALLARSDNFAVFQTRSAKTQVFAKNPQGFSRFCRQAKDLLLIVYNTRSYKLACKDL